MYGMVLFVPQILSAGLVYHDLDSLSTNLPFCVYFIIIPFLIIYFVSFVISHLVATSWARLD
jgi:hypothetical protein